MRIILKAATLAALATAAIPATAQTGGTLVVDIDRLMAESVAGKSALGQMQAKYNGTISAQQGALNTAITGYNGQAEAARKVIKPDGSGLPDAQRAQIVDAEQKVRAADEALNRTQQEVQAVQGYVRQQIGRAVLPIAEQVRAERRATAVVPRASVLALDPTADVTTLVLQRLDAQLKTVSIALPQQQAQGGAPAARPATTTPPRQQPPQGR